ncbi:MAG: sulfatase/phosphatase domain-containing protein, partial [Planctomycetota bacterium]
RIEAGRHSHRVLASMDVAPTILEAAGVKYDGPIDGISFLDTLLGKKEKIGTRDLFFFRREGGDRYGGQTISAVRRGDWKLLQNSPWDPFELYNVKTDPRETNERSRQHPDVYRALLRAMRKQIQRNGAVPWQKPVGR